MAWVAGANVSTGDLITSAQWNNYLGTAGSLEYLGDTQELYVQCSRQIALENYVGIFPVVSCSALNAYAAVSFRCPDNFAAILAAKFLVIPAVTDAAANWDISFSAGAVGQAYNTHTGSNTTTTYNVTVNQLYGIDFSSIMTAMAAGDICAAMVELADALDDFHAVGFYLKYSV